MDKFTILFLLGTAALVFINWADALKPDAKAYKVLSIIGYAAFVGFEIYGLIHVLIELVRV